jgi:hypothetical protein
MSIDLSALTRVEALTPTMSTTFSNDYRAALCADNDFSTLCATQVNSAVNSNWISVAVPSGTRYIFTLCRGCHCSLAC